MMLDAVALAALPVNLSQGVDYLNAARGRTVQDCAIGLVSSMVARAVSPSRRSPSAAQIKTCVSSRITAMPTNPTAVPLARTALRTATPCPASFQ